MSFPEYGDYDGLGLAELVKKKEVTPGEILEEAIRRTEALNPDLNFLIFDAFDEGRRMAADPALPDGPFKGVPWLIKELATAWEGQPMTNACPYMKDLVAPFDSHAVTLTKGAGFTLLGKSNAPELGWALACEPRLFGTTKNPWDTSRTPGGSSGGAAAAVAARVLPIAEASDGGGSIRVPASHSGLVGLKPSRGRISMAPAVVDFWYGGALFFCLTRSVRDTAAYLDVVNGSLPGEPYYAPKPATSFLTEAGTAPGKLKIALVTDAPAGCTPVDGEVAGAVQATGKLLEELGHTVEAQPLPYDFWQLNDLYTRITALQTAGWIDAMGAFVGRPPKDDDLAPLYVSMIEIGRAISGVEHSNDVEAMRMICRDMVGKMAAYDAWLMPTIPVPAREHGWYDMALDADTYNKTRMGADSAYSAPMNASGQPSISLPLHMTAGGLPIGMQFVGRDRDEATLLRLAAQLEEALPWKDRRPAMVS
ncbi:MAG: amidase [Rhodospirillaceae bacterium]|jgi:amidase|nr:amidase [Rhodospirillaceae bacterium]MBT5039527.1 amidase [Rhodospirillaceae bacterium]MBT5778030.1 amidase [Rhodospirillaceae bacterium]MBT6829882.1 amidase [Rhodospirillaceae bacterium]MBT7293828.1 amidase [Rhodospirillaceae bacterium]